MADRDSRPTSNNPSDAQATELRMRRHLGLAPKGATAQQRPDQARQRHRFVQDGGVPVVVLNQRNDEYAALRERTEALSASLDNERNAHAGSKKTISELQLQVTSLETRLAHTELAHRESAAQDQRTRIALQEQIAQLQAPAAAAPVPQAEIPAPRAPRPKPAQAEGQTAAPKKRGRPRIHPPKEAKPVRWWTPSFKARQKA